MNQDNALHRSSVGLNASLRASLAPGARRVHMCVTAETTMVEAARTLRQASSPATSA